MPGIRKIEAEGELENAERLGRGVIRCAICFEPTRDHRTGFPCPEAPAQRFTIGRRQRRGPTNESQADQELYRQHEEQRKRTKNETNDQADSG